MITLLNDDQTKMLNAEKQLTSIRQKQLSLWVQSLRLQFAPEEFLFRAGEVASEMFFVTSGAVDEIIESQVSAPCSTFPSLA